MNDTQVMDMQASEPASTAELVRGSETRVEKHMPDGGANEPLFPGNDSDGFRSRWHEIQGNFVDEPRRAVEQADQLVATVIKRLAEVFADERNRMEHDWSQGQDVSTEDLRQSLRRYRSFFDRLLSV
jgi:hypothetical protein